jgi:hypothetical protein
MAWLLIHYKDNNPAIAYRLVKDLVLGTQVFLIHGTDQNNV